MYTKRGKPDVYCDHNPYEGLSLEELFALADEIGSKYQDDDEIPDWEKEAIANAVDATKDQ